jgi:hypothetical protein
MFPSDESTPLSATLLANLCALVFDFMVRCKSSSRLTFFVVRQLPVLPPSRYNHPAPWTGGASVAEWITERVVELVYTAHDVAAFADDVGFSGPPFRWKDERRFLLRAELDAAFFHLYGIGRDDAEHVLDSFWVVRARDVRRHGEYRTKRVILEIYDDLAKASASGHRYETRLDPPPAADECRHRADLDRREARTRPGRSTQ